MLNQTAKELARDIGKGKLSSLEVTDFFIDRIEQHNSTINAVIAERFDEARKEAQRADEMVKRGEPLG